MAIMALNSAATGLRALSTRIDVVANNLANAETTAFKRSRVNFEDLMYITLKEPGYVSSEFTVLTLIEQAWAAESVGFNAEMFIREGCCEAAARRTVQKADLNQVRLNNLLDRIFLLMNRGRNGPQSNRATVELLDDRQH